MSEQARASSPATRWVVGLDIASSSQRDADHLALELAQAARAAGVDDSLVVATHLVPGEGGFSSHLAVSLGADGEMSTGLLDVLVDRCVTVQPAARPQEVGVWTDGVQAGFPQLRDGARHAHDGMSARTDGRCVVYPGSALLTGEIPVARVLERTAVDELNELGGAPAVDPSRVLVTREHVRPVLREGRLVLDVQAAVGGTLVPFENPSPTPCCADH